MSSTITIIIQNNDTNMRLWRTQSDAGAELSQRGADTLHSRDLVFHSSTSPSFSPPVSSLHSSPPSTDHFSHHFQFCSTQRLFYSYQRQNERAWQTSYMWNL